MQAASDSPGRRLRARDRDLARPGAQRSLQRRAEGELRQAPQNRAAPGVRAVKNGLVPFSFFLSISFFFFGGGGGGWVGVFFMFFFVWVGGGGTQDIQVTLHGWIGLVVWQHPRHQFWDMASGGRVWRVYFYALFFQ